MEECENSMSESDKLGGLLHQAAVSTEMANGEPPNVIPGEKNSELNGELMNIEKSKDMPLDRTASVTDTMETSNKPDMIKMKDDGSVANQMNDIIIETLSVVVPLKTDISDHDPMIGNITTDETTDDLQKEAVESLLVTDNQIDASSANLDVPDAYDEDVPMDFFDDFTNKDFLAGLDIVDAWEEEGNVVPHDVMYAMDTENADTKVNDDLLNDKNISDGTEKDSALEKCEVQCEMRSELNDGDAQGEDEDHSELPAKDHDDVSQKTDEDADKISNVVETTLSQVKEVNDTPIDVDDCQKEEVKEQGDGDKVNDNAESKEKNDTAQGNASKLKASRDKRTKSDRSRKNKRSKSPKKRKSVSVSPVRSRERVHANTTRRDPDKVRRDIQRDKDKCEKERIVEKLKIVETGLVPPGMEMEATEESIRRSPTGTHRSNRTSTSPIRKTSRRSSSATRRPARRSATPNRRSPSPMRKTRPGVLSRVSKRSLQRSPSPYRKRPRSRSLSPVRPRRKYSPASYKRRSRSPIEDRRMRSRTKSPVRRHRLSSERSRSRDRHFIRRSPETGSRKPSFLEELSWKLMGGSCTDGSADRLAKIKAQLNGETQASIYQRTPQHTAAVNRVNSMMQAAPQMVPAPVHHNATVYDQSYFIGSDAMPQGNPYNQQAYSSGMYYQHMQHPGQPATIYNAKEMNKKLLDDDNISFTEYFKLSYTDKAQDIDINQKLRVLNSCQDTLKLLAEMSRPNGRFFCSMQHKQKLQSAGNEDVNVAKTQSPLKTAPVVQLQFTNHPRATDEAQMSALMRLLTKLGVRERTRFKYCPAANELPVTSTQSTQTTDIACANCEERDRKKYADVGVQCGPSTAVFTSQVNEQDFLGTARSSLSNLLKKQSLSNLTPAQLMAGEGRTEMGAPTANFDRGGAGGGGSISIGRPDYERRQPPQDPRARADYGRQLAASTSYTPTSAVRPQQGLMHTPQRPGMNYGQQQQPTTTRRFLDPPGYGAAQYNDPRQNYQPPMQQGQQYRRY